MIIKQIPFSKNTKICAVNSPVEPSLLTHWTTCPPAVVRWDDVKYWAIASLILSSAGPLEFVGAHGTRRVEELEKLADLAVAKFMKVGFRRVESFTRLFVFKRY